MPKKKSLTKLRKQEACFTNVLKIKLFSNLNQFISKRVLPPIAINYSRELVSTSLVIYNLL